MEQYTLSLIIPCYNEEKTLRACVDRVLCLRDEVPALEVIIVDDCSQDASLEVAESLARDYPEVRVLKHGHNQGKGAALRTGLLEATGDFVGIQDADEEYNPLEYTELLAPMLAGQADVVYGSRYLRPSTRRVLYFWHTQMNRLLTFFSNMFTDLGITDMETCYKLFRRDIIQKIAPKLREKRFGFEPEVTALVAEEKCRVYECAISYNPRTFEEGKKIRWTDGVHALYCILHYGAHRAPLPMQLLLYFFIGLVCAILNISLFALLIQEFSLFVSVTIAFALAAALNYLLCILILFRHKARWSAKNEVFAYIAGVCVMWLLDYFLTSGLAYAGLSAGWAKSWATLAGFFGNFLLRKFLVF